MANKIRVLIVDDSSLVRQLLTEILNSDSGIEVVGVAHDPYDARKKIKKLNPDVLTLDIEMPRMDGITFLSNLMRLHPLPVVMVSTMTEKGADVTLEALELGAVDFVSKPKSDFANNIKEYTEELISKVKMAARVNINILSREPKSKVEPRQIEKKHSADAVLEKKTVRKFKATDKIIAIGASTGGTEAIKEVLLGMPADAPGIVITQHIPGAFSKSFAERMNRISKMIVYEAEDGQQILRGHVYIAPGGQHLMIERKGTHFVCRLNDGPPVNRHKPSVDVLFRSVAQNFGPNAVSVMLTGMGDDGANGMKEMHDNGSATIAQDEKTSVVWGMPGEAVALGCVDHVLPLQSIAIRALLLTED